MLLAVANRRETGLKMERLTEISQKKTCKLSHMPPSPNLFLESSDCCLRFKYIPTPSEKKMRGREGGKGEKERDRERKEEVEEEEGEEEKRGRNDEGRKERKGTKEKRN